jgi:hypothetical protein
MTQEERVEFTPPEGVVPEGTAANETFDVVCTFRVESSGEVCLIQIGDEKLPCYDEEETNKPKTKSPLPYAEESESMTSAMQDNGVPGG